MGDLILVSLWLQAFKFESIVIYFNFLVHLLCLVFLCLSTLDAILFLYYFVLKFEKHLIFLVISNRLEVVRHLVLHRIEI